MAALSVAFLQAPVMTRHPVTSLPIWLDPCLVASLLRKTERFLLLTIGLLSSSFRVYFAYIVQGYLDNDILN